LDGGRSQPGAIMILASMVALGIGAGALSAQVAVQVVDGGGRPVPAVQIDVYGFAELLEVASSDALGLADVTTPRWDEVRRLSLSHIGFRTLIVQAEDLPSNGVLRLEPRPIGIEGLSVEAVGSLCPAEDDPVARQIWEEVAARYAQDTGARALSATYLFGAGPVSETALFRIDKARLSPEEAAEPASVWRPEEGINAPLEQFARSDGYSWRPARRRWGGRVLNRVYPEFDGRHAYHFATSAFGALHNFVLTREREGEQTLAFCPNGSGRGTTISGSIALKPGHSFVGAEWGFAADDPDEGAGGEVRFEPYDEGGMRIPHLLAAQGIFFRHSGRKSPYPDLPRAYYREVRAEASWVVQPPRRR
jgi:hypothetical protein